MTADERRIVEWVIWNVRVCDLPGPVREAVARVGKTGCYPRPGVVGRYGPLTVTVHAFPRDETEPLIDRWCSRAGVGAVVDSLLTDGIDYLLVHQERPADSDHDGRGTGQP